MSDQDFQDRIAKLIEDVERDTDAIDTINSAAKFAIVVEVCQRLLAEEASASAKSASCAT